MMKIVFMSGGAREKALEYLIKHGESVLAVITPRLSGSSRFDKVVATALKYHIAVIQVTSGNIVRTLKKIKYDILVSCGFPYIIGNDAIKTAKYAINVHPTLLPKYRGYRSGPYVIINGEDKSGVTVHWLTKKVDAGDILAQKIFPVTKFDTNRSIYRKCQKIEPELLYSVIQQLKKGIFKAFPQDESKSSLYGYRRKPQDSKIYPGRPLKDLYNEIRACDPESYPAFFYVAGQKVCIKLWRPNKPKNEFDMI